MFNRKVEKNIFNDDQQDWLNNYLLDKKNNLEIISLSEQDMMDKKPLGKEALFIEEALGRLRYQIPIHEIREDLLDRLHNIANTYNSKLKLNKG